ncbi:MAG: hypothetical protein MPJ22_00930 [Pirellulales bacterium]|nr:hypothetical protein [Pirellulales bacterium]
MISTTMQALVGRIGEPLVLVLLLSLLQWALGRNVSFFPALSTEWWFRAVLLQMTWFAASPTNRYGFVCCCFISSGLFYSLPILALGPGDNWRCGS